MYVFPEHMGVVVTRRQPPDRTPNDTDDLLGILGLSRPSWWRDAACRGVGVDVFFATEEGPTAEASAAKAICGRCPVRTDCLAAAVEHSERAGIWGGLNEIERRGLHEGSSRDWRRRAG